MTPVGRFGILRACYRPDRLGRPRSNLPFTALRPTDGWCDDPTDRRYNRPVRLPCGAGHERMWRDDPLYDLVLDLSYNRAPTIRGRGSAIFLHVARPGLAPTEGCVALDARRLRHLLGRIGPRTQIEVVR